MNKNFLFFSLSTLFTGLLLGYAGNYITRSISESYFTLEKRDHVQIRRFGDLPKGGQTSPTTTEKSGSQLKELDQNILRLAKLNLEQIQAKIDQISQKPGYPFQLSSFDRISLVILNTRLGQKAPLQALARIDRLPLAKRPDKSVILSAWSVRNPEAAMNYCLREKNPSDPEKYAQIIAKSSPDAAFEWIGGFSDEQKLMAKMGLLFEVSESHPEKLGETIPKLVDLKDKYCGIHGDAAAQWVKRDKEAAMKWINTLPEKQKREAMAEALGTLPLEESTRELSALTGEAKAIAISRIVYELTSKNQEQSIEQTVEWVMKNADSDTESLEKISASLIFDYLKPSVKEYIAQMPAGEMKDLLIKHAVFEANTADYSRNILQDVSLEETLSFAVNAGNTEKREKIIDESIELWILKDTKEVRQWLDKSDMSQEKKKNFYETCDRVDNYHKED